MKTNPRLTSLLYALCCLCLLIGCDRIFRRQIIIDFRNNKAKSLTVAEPADLDNLFSRIEGIAQRNGFRCRPYDVVRKSYTCYNGTVTLATYVTAEKAVRIELTQFGPWSETRQFMDLKKDLSDFIEEEFPGQNVQMTNPLE